MFRRTVLLPAIVFLAAQSSSAVAQQSAIGTDAPSQPPSALVSSAINVVAKAGNGVDLNKWKGSSSVRDDADANLVSMQKDLSAGLPPLLSASDANPDSAAAALPVLLNIDALYSVLLRITIASRAAAPKEQNTQLEQAAITLDNARRNLGDRITATVAANEKKVSALQATVKEQAVALQAAQAPPPPLPVPPAKAPVKKKKPATTTVAKPVTATPAKPPQ